MRPNIPPNLLPVVDAPCLNQQIDIAHKTGVGVEMVGDVSAGKLFEDFAPVGFQSGVVSHPERGRRGKRKYAW